MAASKRRPPYGTVRSLYGELEHARREWEDDKSSEGGKAFELWLELLDVADWCAGTTAPDDDEDDDIDTTMGGDSPDMELPFEGPPLQATGRPSPRSGDVRNPSTRVDGPVEDVPRGTLHNEVRGRAMARATRGLMTGARTEMPVVKGPDDGEA